MSRKLVALMAIALLAVGGAAAMAATTQDVTVTVTIRSIGVSVSPTTYGFGYMDLGEELESTSALVITNEGNVAEDIGLRISDEDSWDEWTSQVGGLAALDENEYDLGCALAATQAVGSGLTTTTQWCDGALFAGGGNDMTAGGTVNMWFALTAPPSVSGDHAYDQHTITVEVSCRVAQ